MIFHKDRNREEIEAWIATWRAGDSGIVTTNGVFDILHAGHIHSFEQIRHQVGMARLIVGVNSDESAKQLEKGGIRPVQSEESRAIVLDALRYPDMVVLFDEPTPCELLELIQPDIHFKGGDYSPEKMELPEASVVRKHGGAVRLVPLLEGYSTTKIIQKIAYAACPAIDSCPVRHGVGACGFPDICPPLPSIGDGRRVLALMEEKAGVPQGETIMVDVERKDGDLMQWRDIRGWISENIPAEEVAEAMLNKAKEVNENGD